MAMGDIHDVQAVIVLDAFDSDAAKQAGEEAKAQFMARFPGRVLRDEKAAKAGRQARMAWALRHTTLDDD